MILWFIVIVFWLFLCLIIPSKDYKKEEEETVRKVLELQRKNGWIK